MIDQRAIVGLLRRLAGGASLEELRREAGWDEGRLRAAFARAAELLGGSPEAATLPPRDEALTLAPADADRLRTVSPSPELPAPRRALVPGYEVLEELGRGGMGVVYKARHLKLNRVVALKMILAGDHASAEVRARFEREAEAVAALQHPNVVQVFEVGEHDGQSYLALEYVPGGSLAARLTDEPWGAGEAAALVEKLACAVEAAHARGIVHRDLKPENVLLTDSGEPKVTDFGLAKRLDDSSGRTRTGEVMGTPHYMAPEQAAGRKDVGPQADVWALGAILHRLLSGKVLFDAPTTLDVIMRVIEAEPPPLRRLNAKVPRGLETVVLKCLHKAPARRYRTAGELADDLRRFREGEPVRARPVSALERGWAWAKKRPVLAALRGAILAALVSVATVPLVARGQLTGLAWVALFLTSLAALLRARRLPLALGSAVSLLVVGPAALLVAGLALAEDEPADEGVVAAIGGVALSLGVVVGAAFTERWRTWLAGLAVAGLAVAAFCLRGAYVAWLIAAALALAVGVITRLVRRRWPGHAVDVVCGCLGGAVVGVMFGAILANIIAVMAAGSIEELSDSTWYLVTVSLLVGGLGLTGAVVGAIAAASLTRPADRS